MLVFNIHTDVSVQNVEVEIQLESHQCSQAQNNPERKCHVLYKHASNTEHTRYQSNNKTIMLQIVKILCNINAVERLWYSHAIRISSCI